MTRIDMQSDRVAPLRHGSPRVEIISEFANAMALAD